MFLFVGLVHAVAQKTITGTISDDQGIPLPGASIVVLETNHGASSDFDGNYSIEATEGQSLIFSYVGYASQTIPVGTDSTLNFQLQPDNSLDEVVVTALGL